MICARFEYTASISTDTTGDPGGSGSMTFVTRKCFSLCRGSTAVHFVRSSFFVLNAFSAGRVITIYPARNIATRSNSTRIE